MAQPQLSFDRNVQVRVFATIVNDKVVNVDEADGTDIIYGTSYTQFASRQDDGSPGFRIRGKITQVEATVSIGINPITFAIYNLGPDSRALFQSQIGTKIQILAGYGTSPKQIAVGNLLWSQTHKEGTDYITECICGDGHFAMTNGQITISFKGPVTYEKVVDTIMANLAQVGLFPGTIELPAGGYNNGFVMSGSPLEILKSVCDKLTLRYVIISNSINIIPVGTDIGAPVIELSEDVGLIGIPQIRAPGAIFPTQATESVSPQNQLSFTTLLRPEIGMFQKVKISSKFVNGEFVCGRVVHDFDSWSGPYYTHCEAAKVGQ